MTQHDDFKAWAPLLSDHRTGSLLEFGLCIMELSLDLLVDSSTGIPLLARLFPNP